MVEINNKIRSKIDLALIKKITDKFLNKYKKINHDVSIVFVGDTVIKRLNKVYRKKDKITDVLSFPATVTPDEDWRSGTGDGENKYLGEIIIDYAQIKRQAGKYGNSVKKELVFILAHGLLHLLGHEDKTEKGRIEMERLGNKFIGKINF